MATARSRKTQKAGSKPASKTSKALKAQKTSKAGRERQAAERKLRADQKAWVRELHRIDARIKALWVKANKKGTCINDVLAFREERDRLRERKSEVTALLQAQPLKVGRTYMHVSDSGISFVVQDEGHGPTIKVSMHSFGAISSEMKAHVTPKELLALAEMFAQAAENTYSPEHGCAARVLGKIDYDTAYTESSAVDSDEAGE